MPTPRSLRLRSPRVVLLTVLCLVGVVLPLTDAAATTPGSNGAIAFKHYLDADRSTGAIVTVWPDGTHWKQVTRPSSGTVDDQPDWAPDGSLVAFRRCAPDQPCAIYTVRPDGTALRRITPTCSPGADETTCADESEVAFLRDSHHVLLTRATGRVRVLSDGDGWIEHSDIVVRDLRTGHDHVVRRSRPFTGDNVEMVASPSGGRIVFLRSNSPLGQPASAQALFVVRWDGTHVRRLTPWSLEAGDHPDWSPDGKWILYRAPDRGDFLDSQLYVVHPDGRGMRQVTHVPSGTRLLSSSFSPDGRRVVFGQDGRAGEPDIFTMGVHGGPVHQVTYSPRWDSAPDWGPRRS